MGKPSLSYQIKNILNGMIDFTGQEKNNISAKTLDPSKIYSKSTLETYKKECCAFAAWARAEAVDRGEKIPHSIEDIRHLAADYLERKRPDGSSYSVWTLKTQRAAIAKLYGERCQDIATLPDRHRADIKRSRNEATTDKSYNPANHVDVETLGRGAGLRRSDFSRVRGKSVTEGADGFLHVFIDKGKGGKSRDILVDPDFAAGIRALAAKVAPGERIIPPGRVPAKLDEHANRRAYAQSMLKLLSRPEKDIPKADRYVCRNDAKGIVLDKKAMAIVSRSLGHGSVDRRTGKWNDRIDVIAGHYVL